MKKLFAMCLVCTTIVGVKLIDTTIVINKEQPSVIETIQSIQTNFECIDEKDMAQTYEDIEVVEEYDLGLAYMNMC